MSAKGIILRLVVTFLDSTKLQKLRLPFKVLSPDDNEIEFSIEDSASEQGQRIRVYCRSIGVPHEEPLVDMAALTTMFLRHGFYPEGVVGFGQLSTVAAPNVKLTQDENLLVSLYACATFRLGIKPHVAPRKKRPAPHRHRLFLPALAFVPYLQLGEMLRLTQVCRSACELVYRRTRLSAHGCNPACQRGFSVAVEVTSRCNDCSDCYERVRSLSENVDETSIGDYHLPYPNCVQNPLLLNSFLFQAFGLGIMMERSWYTRLIWKDVLNPKERIVSVRWTSIRSTEEVDVTDETDDNHFTAGIDDDDDDDSDGLCTYCAAERESYPRLDIYGERFIDDCSPDEYESDIGSPRSPKAYDSDGCNRHHYDEYESDIGSPRSPKANDSDGCNYDY